MLHIIIIDMFDSTVWISLMSTDPMVKLTIVLIDQATTETFPREFVCEGLSSMVAQYNQKNNTHKNDLFARWLFD